jgi:hypothetical protein
MSSNSSKELTISYTKWNANHLTFTELQENDRSKGQLIAYPRFDHPSLGENQPLMLQLPWIKLDAYGIPRVGEYYKTAYERAFVKTPLRIDDEDSEVSKLVEKLKEIDDTYSSEDMKKKLFGKKWKKYKFYPIVRFPELDDDEENADKKPPYCKLKLDLSYPDNEVKTKVYTSVLDTETDKRKRELVECSTVDDVAEVVRYLSSVRFIIRPVKMWAQPAKKSDPAYGIVWKIVKAEVQPSDRGNSTLYNSYYNNNTFLDSDDDDNDNEVVVHKSEDAPTNMSSDSSDSSDSDEEDVVNVKKKKGKKVKNSSA